METKTKSEITKAVLILVNVVAIILLITGIVQTSRAVFKTVAFDKYPLEQFEMVQSTPSGEKTISDEEVNVTRKLRMMEDYLSAISLLLVSGGLFWINRKYNK